MPNNAKQIQFVLGNQKHCIHFMIVYDSLIEREKSILRSCNITQDAKAGCLITSLPKVNISSKIEIHSPAPPVSFDVWVSRSYIRHQGQSLKRRVNLQTDIRGRGFSCTGRAKRAGAAAAPQPPHLSDLNGTDSSRGSAKAASLLASLHTSIYEQERKQFSSELTKAVYVGTSKPRESVVQRPVNCFTVFPMCPYRHGS